MKRGFTLIEMLATIVIIGIIALVAIPVVTNAVEDAKIGVAKRNIENLEDIINRKIAIDLLKGDNSEKSYVYSDGKSTSGDLDKAFKGKRPDEAIIHVNKDGKIEYAIYYEDTKTCAYKSYDSNEYTFKKNITGKNKCISKLSINLLTNMQVNSLAGLKNYKDKISDIDFVDYINVPDGTTKYDMSLEKNNSIIGWLEPTDNNLYKLYIGSEGGIYTSTRFSMFFDMPVLETVNFDNISTINATSMSKLFWNCFKLKRIYNINNLDTNNVIDMSEMFYGCKSLEELDVSHFNTSNSENMHSMFNGLKKVPVLDVSHFNTSKVTDMSGMFSDCNFVKTLDVSHFDTSKVTNMAFMFNGCNTVTNLDLNNFSTLKVTNMGYMFAYCKSLTNLDISNFNTKNVTDFQGTFMRLTGLTGELDLSTLNTSNANNMAYMFSGNSLSALDLSNFNTSNVTNMSHMFSQSENLTNLNLSSFNTSNVTDMSWMFFGLHALPSINLSNFNTSKVSKMSDMFTQCYNLTELDLTNFDISKVTDMDYMFAFTNKLNIVYVNNAWDTSKVSNKDYMFLSSKIDHVTVKSTN